MEGGRATGRVPIRELVRYFLRLGLLGFGGPVALVGQMERELRSDYRGRWTTLDGIRRERTADIGWPACRSCTARRRRCCNWSGVPGGRMAHPSSAESVKSFHYLYNKYADAPPATLETILGSPSAPLATTREIRAWINSIISTNIPSGKGGFITRNDTAHESDGSSPGSLTNDGQVHYHPAETSSPRERRFTLYESGLDPLAMQQSASRTTWSAVGRLCTVAILIWTTFFPSKHASRTMGSGRRCSSRSNGSHMNASCSRRFGNSRAWPGWDLESLNRGSG
jgi:hypothetical protein